MTAGDPLSVLVVGNAGRVLPILNALRSRGLRAWSDEAGNATADHVSFEWADAVVLVDDSPTVTESAIGLLASCKRPTMLVTSAPLDSAMRTAIFGRGIEAIETWPAPAELIAARVARLLGQSAADGPSGDEARAAKGKEQEAS